MNNIPRYERLVVRYARWVVDCRWLVLLLSLLIIGVLTAGAKNLKFSTDYRAYFGKDNPQLLAFDEVQNVYNKNDNILLMFEPQSGNVFEPRFLEAILKFTEDAWKLPYASRVDSIANFQHTEAVGDDLRADALIRGPEDLGPEHIAKIKTVTLQEPLLLNRLISARGHETGINIIFTFPPVGQQTQKELPTAVAATRELRDRYLREYPEIGGIYMFGSNMMSISFTEAAKKDLSTLVPAMYAAIFLIMWLMLRSGWAVFGTLLVVFFSSMAAMGIAGYLGIGLSPPVVQAPQIITVLAVADSVHICLTMFALMRAGWDKHKAIIESMRINFTPVFLVSATTSICFLGTNFTDSPPLTALGNITSMGGMLSWLLAITLLPTLLAILPARVPRERKAAFLVKLMDRHADFVLMHKKPVFWVTLAVVLGLTALVPLNEANDKLAHYFDKSIQFRTDSDHIVQNMTGTYSMEFSLKCGESECISDPAYLQKLEEFAQWWRGQPKVLYVSTISDIFKRLNKNMHGDDPSYYRLPDQRNLAAQYLLLYEMSLPFGLDLTNSINQDKSSTRFIVIFEHLKSKETRAIEVQARQWLHEHAPEMETYGVSPAVMFAHISKRNIESNFISLPLSMAAISLLLLPGLRSWKFGLLTLIPNLLPLGVAFGVWALINGEIIFTMAVVINMVVGIIVDDTIHFLHKYLRGRREMKLDPENAIRYAFHEAGSAMVVTTLILAVGFLILAQSAFLPNSTMSLLTTIAIVLALPIDLLLLPTLVLLVDRDKSIATDPETQEIEDEPVAA